MDTELSPIKRSPLYDAAEQLGARFILVDGWKVPHLFGSSEEEVAAARSAVTVADVTASGKLLIEGAKADKLLKKSWSVPSLAIGQGIEKESKQIYRLRDDQFLVKMEAGSEDDSVAELTKAIKKKFGLLTITNLTDGRSDLLLVGPKSASLLSRLCGLDFDVSSFPHLCAKQSSVAKTRQLIIHQDILSGSGPPIMAYYLIGDRSLALYLWETIMVTGQNLGIVPIGQSTVDILIAES